MKRGENEFSMKMQLFSLEKDINLFGMATNDTNMADLADLKEKINQRVGSILVDLRERKEEESNGYLMHWTGQIAESLLSSYRWLNSSSGQGK